jgi:hypothetical protein
MFTTTAGGGGGGVVSPQVRPLGGPLVGVFSSPEGRGDHIGREKLGVGAMMASQVRVKGKVSPQANKQA